MSFLRSPLAIVLSRVLVVLSIAFFLATCIAALEAYVQVNEQALRLLL